MSAFDKLPAAVANDAVRAVEDVWHRGGFFFPSQVRINGDEGPDTVRRLLELGWTPPAL